MAPFPEFADHLYIWIFGIILPFLTGLQSSQLSGGIRFDAPLRKKLYLSNSLLLALAGSSVVILWAIKKRAFSSMGFQLPDWTNYTTLMFLLLIFIGLYVVDLFISLRKKNHLTKRKHGMRNLHFYLRNGESYPHLFYYAFVQVFSKKSFTGVSWSLIFCRMAPNQVFHGLPFLRRLSFSAWHIFTRDGWLFSRFSFLHCCSISYSFRQKAYTQQWLFTF